MIVAGTFADGRKADAMCESNLRVQEDKGRYGYGKRYVWHHSARGALSDDLDRRGNDDRRDRRACDRIVQDRPGMCRDLAGSDPGILREGSDQDCRLVSSIASVGMACGEACEVRTDDIGQCLASGYTISHGNSALLLLDFS